MGFLPGGGVKIFFECDHQLLQISSILCMVIIRSQAVGL